VAAVTALLAAPFQRDLIAPPEENRQPDCRRSRRHHGGLDEPGFLVIIEDDIARFETFAPRAIEDLGAVSARGPVVVPRIVQRLAERAAR
jgi:hypothetical protein